MGRKRRLEDQELLAFARECFVAEGFGASTRAIAERAGVAEAILFQRFRTKPELFFAAMIPPAPDLHAILVSGPRAEAPARRLEEIALKVLSYFREVMPVLLPLVSHPGFDYEEFIQRYPESPLNQLVGGLQAWLAYLEERGIVLAAVAPSVAILVVGTMASLAMFEKIGVHGGNTDEALVREIARTIWRGAAAT